MRTRSFSIRIVRIFGLLLLSVLASSCPTHNKTGGVSIQFVHGFADGKTAVLYDGSLPSGWPPEFKLPSGALIPDVKQPDNQLVHVVHMSMEQAVTYYQSEFRRVGLEPEVITGPARSYSLTYIRANYEGRALSIRVYSAGWDIVVIPPDSAAEWVRAQLSVLADQGGKEPQADD
jgi:hypothetical protein